MINLPGYTQFDGIGMTSQRTRDRLVARLRENGVNDERVLSAIATVPRHLFVDEALSSRAYEDTALPIGLGQTISQPYVVALMTQVLLENDVPDQVLEVGTGSGYQAAILSLLVGQVFTVERIDELSRLARKRFRQLSMRNIRSKCSDGGLGWEENGPYGGIIVTAAGLNVPTELFKQLSDQGRLVAPVGPSGKQRLVCYQKNSDGSLTDSDLGAVSFVPLLTGRRL